MMNRKTGSGILIVFFLLLGASKVFGQAPIIDSIAVDEMKSQLLIWGSFSQTEGQVAIEWVPLTVIDWTPGIIITTLPDTGVGSCGKVQVAIGSESATRYLTRLGFTLEYTFTGQHPGFESAQFSGSENCNLAFRLDLSRVGSHSLACSQYNTIAAHYNGHLNVYLGSDETSTTSSQGSQSYRLSDTTIFPRVSASYTNNELLLEVINSGVLQVNHTSVVDSASIIISSNSSQKWIDFPPLAMAIGIDSVLTVQSTTMLSYPPTDLPPMTTHQYLNLKSSTVQFYHRPEYTSAVQQGSHSESGATTQLLNLEDPAQALPIIPKGSVLYDCLGRVVRRVESSAQIDFKSLSDGVYFYLLKDSAHAVGKILVRH